MSRAILPCWAQLGMITDCCLPWQHMQHLLVLLKQQGGGEAQDITEQQYQRLEGI